MTPVKHAIKLAVVVVAHGGMTREKKSALEWCVPGRSGRMAELGEGTKTRQSKRNLTVEPRADSDLTSDSTLKGSRRKASW
jgi:hypothetical protein